MINNGTMSYVHDGAVLRIAGCETNFRNAKNNTQLSINYFHEKLTVSVDIQNKNEWKVCFELENVKLPADYYFGASASTGDLSDNHDIISFKFYELES